MAKQSTRFLDVTKSYLLVDPNSFFDTLSLIDKSDFPEGSVPVVAYEGYNFLPTSYGYKSYFGTTSALDIEALGPQVDDVFIIQTQTFQNIAVALTPTGIYTKEADSEGAWEHAIVMDEPSEGVSLNWTKCMIGNELFCYRATGQTYAVFSPIERAVSQGEIEAGADPDTHPANQFYEVVPNFLNMKGQQGIFKAGSRLGFWDSANSIAVSSVDDFAQFTPNIKTGASNVLFNEIKGRITQVLALDDGFVIYATRSIVSIRKNKDSTMQWDPLVLVQDNGVAFQRECCVGENTATQYAYTAAGLFKITADSAEPTAISVVDFLKESKEPVFLKVIDNRYLFLEILDSDYIDGLVTFTVETIPASVQVYPPFTIVNQQHQLRQIRDSFEGIKTVTTNGIGSFDQYLLNAGLPLRKEGTEITPVLQYNWHSEMNTAARSGSRIAGWIGSPRYIDREKMLWGTASAKTAFEVGFVGGTRIPLGVQYYDDWKWLADPRVVMPFDAPPASHPTSFPTLEDYVAYCLSLLDNYGDLNRSTLTTMKATCPFTEEGMPIQAIAFGYGEPSIGVTTYDGYWKGLGSSVSIPDSYTGGSTSTTHRTYYIYNETGGYSPVDEELSLPNDTRTSLTLTTAYNPIYKVETTDDRITFTRENAVSGTLNAQIKFISHLKDDLKVFSLCYDDIRYAEAENEFPSTITNTIVITGYEYTGEDDETYFVSFGAVGNLTGLEGGQSYTFDGRGSITYPPVSFLLQNGSIGPVRPTIPGALVFDTYLEKWGKMRGDYKLLVDWKPLNNASGEVIPYEVFGMQGGIVDVNGTIRLFDMFPVDSYIRYGKIGHHREGFTKIDEVRVRFRTPSAGTLRTDSSLDGYGIELGFSREVEFDTELQVTLYPNISARWHTISLTGIFDIRYLEYRAHEVSNR